MERSSSRWRRGWARRLAAALTVSLSGLVLSGSLTPGVLAAQAAARPQVPNRFDPAARTSSVKGAPLSYQPGLRTAPAPRAAARAGVHGATGGGPVGYIPCDVAHAYGLYPLGLNGTGVTIAIVAPNNDPNLSNDLHAFDSAFGLSDPVLEVQAPNGLGGPYNNPGWPELIAQTVEWAHAAAPGAAIDVAEAATDNPQPNPQQDPVATSLWAVQNLNPDVVVLPWSLSEAALANFYGSTFEATFNSRYFPVTNGAGAPVTYLADAGDTGFGAYWPAVATTVEGVGGTSLQPQAFGYSTVPGSHTDCSGASGSSGVNQTNESVWGNPACSTSPCNGSGGGPSAFEARPTWQSGFGPGGNRVDPDVALLADPLTGVATYWNGAWVQTLAGGNQVSTALWGGVVATVDQELRLSGKPTLSMSSTSNWVYSAKAADFNDVIHGSSPGVPNDPCLTSGACTAAPGYDQVSGRGSPLVPTLVSDLGGSAMPPAGGNYVPVTPVRIMDTRTGLGGHSGPIAGGQTVSLQVGSQNGVVSSAAAAEVNVVVTDIQGTGGGSVLLYPCGQSRPSPASTLNFATDGLTNAVLAQPALGGGCLNIYLFAASGAGSADVLVDVEGYFLPALTGRAGLYNPLNAPVRALDTRTSLGGHQAPLGQGQWLELQVAGNSGIQSSPAIPSSAEAVVLNLTAVSGTASSFLAVYPAPQSGAACSTLGVSTSNLNFAANTNVANRVAASVGNGGNICVFNAAGSVNAIIDVAGWYSGGQAGDTTGSSYVPQRSQSRVYDSRGSQGPLAAGATRDVSVEHLICLLGCTAGPGNTVAINLTTVDEPTSGFLQVYRPGSGAAGQTSDVSFPAGDIRANMAVEQTENFSNGAVDLEFFAGASTDFVIDLYGIYQPA